MDDRFFFAIVISSAVSSSIPHRGGIWFSLGEEGKRGLIPIYVCIALEQLYSPLMFMYNSWNVDADAIFLMHFYGT